MNPQRILIVDDSPAVIKRLTLILGELGHQVVGAAGTGHEAIAKTGELRPDVITMDIQMPEMDGLEATRRILSEHPEQRIVVITAHGQESTVVDAISAGAKYFITKPIEKAKVAEVPDKVLGGE